MKAFVAALAILSGLPAWAGTPDFRMVTAVQRDQPLNRLDWVTDHEGKGHLEACDPSDCIPVTAALTDGEATRFFGFYQDKLAQISQQEAFPRQGLENPLSGTRETFESFKSLWIAQAFGFSTLFASQYFEKPLIAILGVVGATIVILNRTSHQKVRLKEEGRRASGLVRVARQLGSAETPGAVVLIADDYAYLVKTLKLAYKQFARTLPQASR